MSTFKTSKKGAKRRKPASATQELKPISSMAAFSPFRYSVALSFLAFISETFPSDAITSFSFKGFGNGSNFESEITLYGDAKLSHGRNWVRLTDSVSSSAGMMLYKKPIKLLQGQPRNMASFSTNFSFSLSQQNGDGLAFALVPTGLPFNVSNNSSFGFFPGPEERNRSIFAVEFGTFMCSKVGGVDEGSSISLKVSNLSSIKLLLSSGVKLHCWIDYEATSKRLEVRLSRHGDMRPADPNILHSINFLKLWKEGEALVGLSSSNGNSNQTCNVYSWDFNIRPVSHLIHSHPLNPDALPEKPNPPPVHKNSSCLLRMLAVLIIGTGFGAVGTFIILSFWSIFGNRRPVVPEELSVHPGEFEYKKIKIVVHPSKKGEK